MIGKIMGFIDIFAGIIMLLAQFGIVKGYILFSLGLYLIIKFIMFFGDFMSVIDGIVGIYLILMLLVTFSAISILFAAYLIIKGIWSIF
jgi:hypothetical protein